MRATVRRVARGLQQFVPESATGLLILAYHLVDGGTSNPVDLPLRTFEQQMREIRDQTRILALQEAVEILEQGEPLSDPATVVTFDDAYANFLERAWPVLAAMDIPVALYVPVAFVDRKGPPPLDKTEHLRPLTWDQLRELRATGLVTVGSHTRTHPDLPSLSKERAWCEVTGSRSDLEERLGVAIDSFCYPRARWSRPVDEMVQRSYRTGMVAGGRKVRPGNYALSRLARLPLRRDMPASLVPMLASEFCLEERLADWMRQWRT